MADAKESEKPQPVKTALNVAAYGVAGATAVPVFNTSLNEAVYQQNRGYNPIKEQRAKRDVEKDKVREQNKEVPHASAKAGAEVQRNYKKFVKEKLKDLGLADTRDYWTELTEENKWKVAEKTGAIFGIVLTTALTVVNSGWLGKVLSHKETHKKSGTSL